MFLCDVIVVVGCYSFDFYIILLYIFIILSVKVPLLLHGSKNKAIKIIYDV